LEPLLGILLETVAEDSLQTRRDVLVGQREVGRILPQDRRHRVRGGVPAESAFAREHLVEDGAEREDVGSGIGRMPAHLLGRHVAERSEHDPRLRAGGLGWHIRQRRTSRLRPRQLGQAEVQDLQPPVLRDEEVLRLQVPVDNPLLVRRGEAVRHLQRVVDRLPRREASAGQCRAKGLSLEQLLDDVRSAVVSPDVVNRGDVGVVQEPGGPGLLLEAVQPIGVV
jgi:hypothetical protein